MDMRTRRTVASGDAVVGVAATGSNRTSIGRRLAATTLLTAVLASCNWLQLPDADALRRLDVAIVSVVATSSTSLSVVFDAEVDASRLLPSSFTVRPPAGPALDVVGAYVSPRDPSTVRLATAPQANVTYSLAVADLAIAVQGFEAIVDAVRTFEGSTDVAVVVAGAAALSPTRTLVWFVDPVDGSPALLSDEALARDAFSFDPPLTVTSVVFADGEDAGTIDPSRVIVSTAESQVDATYLLSVRGVPTRSDALIDPFNGDAAFAGIAPVDVTPPRIASVAATGDTTFAIEFTEPVDGATAADLARYAVTDRSGESLILSAAALDPFGLVVTLTGRSQVPDVTYDVTATGIQDAAGNVMGDGTGSRGSFLGWRGGSEGDDVGPTIVNVSSTDNTTVVIGFSEKVLGGPNGAENPGAYRFYTETTGGNLVAQATLVVQAVTLSLDRKSVTIVTGSQSDLSYRVDVSNVQDLAGNQLEMPHGTLITFQGTPPRPGEWLDSDSDGLTDDEEQKGWDVSVRLPSGEVSTSEVTSDPYEPDTDEDGVPDGVEKARGMDPRAPDTDGDSLTDDLEIYVLFSSPNAADTDGDGLLDPVEVNVFGTNPLRADTDGDRFLDGDEVVTDARNPRIADMPRLEIRVGSVDLQLDVVFEERTAEGTRVLDTRTVDTTLTQSQESSLNRESSSTIEWFVNAGAEITTSTTPEAKFSANAGVSGSSTSSFGTTSTRAAQREYATSLTTDAEVTAESDVTRIVQGATLAAEVNFTNLSNIAFTVSNVEITALVQDPTDPSILVPVASLFSANGSALDIGPLSPERGPFRFVAQNAFASLVESLMANPRGMIFRIANYDLTDEFGRNFAYVEQDVNDRTAFMEIDYKGNQPLERYQVATNATFDEQGEPTGVTMASIMEDILGLAYVDEAQDVLLDPNDRADADLLDASYSTRNVGGVDVLWRVRRVSRDLTGLARDWWVLGPKGNVTPVGTRPGSDFRSTVVFADQDYALAFVQDLDADDLEALEERLYRSLDSDADVDPSDGIPDSRDTDRDGIDDADEVYGAYQGNRRIRWTVRLEDGRDAYQTAAHPGRADTDGDGLDDCQELLVDPSCSGIQAYVDAKTGAPTLSQTASDGTPNTPLYVVTLLAPTDPANPDTDGDGITDAAEAIGFGYVNLRGDDVVAYAEVVPGAAWATNPLAADTDRDGLDDVLEVRLGSNPQVADGDSVRDDDADGLVNLIETQGWTVTYETVGGTTSTAQRTSDPLDPDSDDDGLTDFEEYWGCRDANRDFVCDTERRYGASNPRLADTDLDGLTDRDEIDGFAFPSDKERPRRETDPLDADTDDDLVSDGSEATSTWQVVVVGSGGYAVASDPLLADADGDGLDDRAERFDHRSDPTKADTDGDGALDGLEAGRVTSVLEPDHLVTVTYLSFQTGKGSSSAASDGDSGDCDEPLFPCSAAGAGDYMFSFDVGRSTSSGSLVTTNLLDPFDVKSCLDPTTPGFPSNAMCGWPAAFAADGRVTQVHVQMPAPLTLFLTSDVLHSKSAATFTFALPFTGLFTLQGFVQELDGGPSPNFFAGFSYFFGGVGDPEATFTGDTLSKGTFGVVFDDSPDSSVPIDITVLVTVQ